MNAPHPPIDLAALDARDPASAFELRATPFTREFSIEKRMTSELHDSALEGLTCAVHDRMSAALVGPAGTGKTVLLRALTDSLPEARYSVHYLKVANLTRRDMCREIATVIGCQATGQYNTLVRKIQERMRTCADNDGLRPVLVIDDAHEFRAEVLGIVRALTNFDMDSRLVVSVILCGQMDLRRMLARDELCDVSRRLAYCATLRNFSREQTHRYIKARLAMVGGSDSIFAKGAYEALYEISGGNMRATDRLALAAMQLAAANSAPQIEDIHVVSAKERIWI